jgi:hypothetical protein
MGWDDFEMWYKLISIVSVLIIGLFLFGLSKNKKRKYKPSSSFFR